MARTDAQYRDQLISLLPPGNALKADTNTTLWQLLWGFAAELSRVDSRMDDLVRESLVSATEELITDFETEFGIPEPGTELGKTLEDRRDVLLAKLVKVGQQNPEYFEDIADKLGYDITVETYSPFLVGMSTMGDTIGNLSVLFRWMVWINIIAGMNWNIQQLIYEITATKPAHTMVFFRFLGAEFSRAFDPRSFNSIRSYDGITLDWSFDTGFSTAFATGYNYDGVNYTGAFSKAFDLSFDSYIGGAFSKTEFSSAFDIPV